MSPSRGSDDDSRERPSWREIDRRRDRSRHVSRDTPSARERSLRSTWAKEQYLKEADKLFQGKRGSKKHQQALNAIHKAHGTAKFAGAVKKYLNNFGLPSDWRTLMMILDYKEEKVVVQAIAALTDLAPSRSTVESQRLRDKLELLTLTALNSRVTAAASAALQTVD
ncbi:MAG: hypothetical protein JRJ12_00095 [Deltaproteobacteria bacterium]|nr:hypothetical protein [Deltaproteobacteria bacterium]MBW2069764.1 hypothetical protein [Deltaproteobacteria bacterium]